MDRIIPTADRARRALLIAGALLLAPLAPVPGSALEVPFLSGHVNDQAGLLDHGQGHALEGRLAAFEARTGHQVVVLTVPSLEGEVLEDYSLRVAETWKLGRAEQDDGVLLLIAKDDRKLRIEVGYGLEGQLTDVLCHRIIDERIVPRFKEGDFAQGVDDGVSALLGLLDGDPEALPEPSGSLFSGQTGVKGILAAVAVSLLLLSVLGLFSAMALITPGGGGWFLYVFMIPFNSLFPIALFGPRIGGIFAITWIVGGPILRLLLPRTARGKRWREKIGPMQWRGGSSSSSSRGWSSGSGGGGGYSGGGGSFGGGGASGGW